MTSVVLDTETGALPDDFDETFYLERHADVRSAVENGVLPSGAAHYRQYGFRENRATRRDASAGDGPSAPVAPAVAADGTPYPPPDLMFLVTNGRDPAIFEATGLADLKAVLEAVREAGVALPEGWPPRVLDWGCGCGRLARHWPAVSPGAQVFGCDINGTLVGWCGENLQFGEFKQCQLNPPLDYADGSFDLIYGISVLTHLTLEEHYRWMCEIWRLLAPGGVAVVTAHGPTMLPTLTAGMLSAGRNVRTSLIDEDVFACLEDEGGSNASCSFMTGSMFAKIFRPFEIGFHRPRFGLMGIHDTYALTKRTAGPLTFTDLFATVAPRGLHSQTYLPIVLDGQANFSVLASATALHYPASASLTVRLLGGASTAAGSETVALPDKIGWTQIDQASALLSIAGIPSVRGPAMLMLDVRSDRPHDGGSLQPLDGAVISLGKAMLF